MALEDDVTPTQKGTFCRLPDGEWGVQVDEAGCEGEIVLVTRADGEERIEVLDELKAEKSFRQDGDEITVYQYTFLRGAERREALKDSL